ncbi:hypothetical protein TWF970_001301 [Orbilia oligospora]|uniref:Uncharacterized protein n=1 Tax=Orbilia oligospora TaxID=2813651 RepID=A0A7C8VC70_ORBOL|nr:hypothetical protein TWF970_001301 [Orbilia oligospora]
MYRKPTTKSASGHPDNGSAPLRTVQLRVSSIEYADIGSQNYHAETQGGFDSKSETYEKGNPEEFARQDHEDDDDSEEDEEGNVEDDEEDDKSGESVDERHETNEEEEGENEEGKGLEKDTMQGLQSLKIDEDEVMEDSTEAGSGVKDDYEDRESASTEETVAPGWRYFMDTFQANLHVSRTLFNFDLQLTDEEVNWCRQLMITPPSDHRNVRGLASYVQEGQYDLMRRISDIAKVAVHSGNRPHYGFQYEIWAYKLGNFPAYTNFPLTAGEVLSLLHSCGKLNKTGLDLEIHLGLDILTSAVMFDALPVPIVHPTLVENFMQIARSNSKRNQGAGFGPWGIVEIEELDFSHDYIVQFYPVDRTTVGDQTLNQQVRPQELLKLRIIRASCPVPTQIQKNSWELSTLLVRKGLKCTIDRSRKKGKTQYLFRATVSCAGAGFKVWTIKAISNSPEAAYRKLGHQLYRQINVDYDHDHFTSANRTTSLGLGSD